MLDCKGTTSKRNVNIRLIFTFGDDTSKNFDRYLRVDQKERNPTKIFIRNNEGIRCLP